MNAYPFVQFINKKTGHLLIMLTYKCLKIINANKLEFNHIALHTK